MPPTVTPGDGGHRCFLSTSSSRISHPAFHSGALLTNNGGNNPNSYSFPIADSRSPPFRDDHSTSFPSYPTFISEKEGVPIICNRYPTSSFQSQGAAPAISPHHSNHRNMNALWSQNQHVTAPPSMLQENSSFRATDLNNNNTHSTDYHILNTEKFVPRIIKPRKRRKKDRKPSSEASPAPAITRPSPSTENNNPKMFHGTHTNDRLPNRTEILPPPSSVPNLSLDLKMTLWQDHHRQPNNHSRSSSEIPTYSTNMICQSLSNILSCGQDISNSNCEEDNQMDERPAAPFCHLDSDVWDAREGGFSSNLMAPITAPQKMIQPTTENSVESPWNNCKNNIVVNLRRSSSEPTSKPVFTNPTINRNRSFSISEREGQNPLGVSSKIVTSHDGHRDIEIKFFSLSTSATKCSNLAESIGSR